MLAGSTVSIMYNDGMNLISVILSGIVLTWLDLYLRRQSKLQISPNDRGSIVLRVDAINARLSAWFWARDGFPVRDWAIFLDRASLQQTVTASAVAAATGLGGSATDCVLTETRSSRFDDEKVELQDIFGKTKSSTLERRYCS